MHPSGLKLRVVTGIAELFGSFAPTTRPKRPATLDAGLIGNPMVTIGRDKEDTFHRSYLLRSPAVFAAPRL